jgi:hypothetical protein
MSDEQPKPPSEADKELERAIRAERKFSLAEAIGRKAGPGAMKGVSPVPASQQAEAEIEDYIRKHLLDAAGVLPGVLSRYVNESDFLLDHFDRPLAALAAYLRRILESEYRLKELVREVDVEWGRVFGERPFFEPRAGRRTRTTRTLSNPSAQVYRCYWKRCPPTTSLLGGDARLGITL